MTKRFAYTTMDDPNEQIRLLHIAVTSRGERLATLTGPYFLLYAPKYAAISYTWGRSEPKVSIVVSGQRIDVTENCAYVLSQLPRAGRNYFWIDSVCINQADLEEKSAQVQLMGEIFVTAETVMASIGGHGGDSPWLFDTVREFAELSSSDRRRTTFDMIRLSSALLRLGRRTYWQRLWIVQEILLGSEVILVCGEKELSLRQLASMCAWFNRRTDPSRLLPSALNRQTPMIKIIQAKLSCISESRSIYMSASKPSLWDMLRYVQSSQCADVRDRVYGIVSTVTWPKHLPPIKTDYRMSVLN